MNWGEYGEDAEGSQEAREAYGVRLWKRIRKD